MNLYARLLWRFFRLRLDNVDDRNAYYLVVELFWAAILGTAATFNAAFAIRLGAENVEVGLLTSIPALMAVLISIPAGRFLERRAHRTPWIWGSLLINRAAYLVAAIVPWIHLPGLSQGLTLVLTIVILTAPAYFFNVGWIPLLAEVISPERRAAVFAARNIINSLTVSVFGFLFGQWLNLVEFPINYQAMYAFGFACSMVSTVVLLRMKVPDSPLPQTQQDNSFKSQFRAMREALTTQPQFAAITRNTLLHGVGVWLASPLYVLYFVRVLNATDGWLGINGTVGAVATVIGFSVWRWIINKWGEPLTLKRTIILVGLYPAIVGMTPSLTVILLLGFINGLVVPGVNLSHFNTLLKTMPPESRPSYTALYTTIMNLGAFVCPLIGVALANVFGLGPVLVFCGLLCIVGSASFLVWPVEESSQLTVHSPQS